MLKFYKERLPGPNKEEQQYLQLIKDILEHGVFESGRNGFTKSIFGSSMHFSLENGVIPLLTTKKVSWKTCLKELLWFIRGHTDANILRVLDGVKIWDDNASRDFLDSRGLYDNEVGDLGPIYGHQWRHFNAEYTGFNTDYTGKGVDQLQQIIDWLKDPEKRSSRRLVMSSWNPCQLDEMALPPCHVLCQFNVSEGNKLSCALYQRSVDVMLGQPFNIASYCFLTHLLSKHCELIPYEFVYYMGNCHIYEQHIPSSKIQITREPFKFPTVSIKQVREKIEDYQVDDFEIIDYNSHGIIQMKMVA
jgi:thymidylate synthase